MRMNYQLKRTCIAIGVMSFSVGILWSYNFGLTPSTELNSLPNATTETTENSNERTIPSFWSQLKPVVPHENPTDVMRTQVETALGVSVADISVTMERPSENEFVIPLRNDRKPVVRISLPASWMMKRAAQLGSKEAVLNSLQSIVTTSIPESKAIIKIVQDSPIAVFPEPTTESYAKQLVMVLGLIALFCCGTIVDRRRGLQEAPQLQQSLSPAQDAQRILEMEYGEAKRTIDSLLEPHKGNVLQAIITSEVKEEFPVVHVQQQPAELSNCS